MITLRVFAVVVLLAFYLGGGVKCRSLETKNYYQVSTTTNGGESRERELVILTQDDVFEMHEFREVEDKTERSKKVSATRCVGPATLMAMCF
ncbi:hypothetical protein Zmor_025855 [Zophobas morio]|uniref:Uncharacterized protein n=1 Tax=Zophobas morio TaxID=2755281 RepID=A0AA38HSZ3_9CUCU|nr:hypothetical protein Zmor_025855 [Zophobas morio]